LSGRDAVTLHDILRTHQRRLDNVFVRKPARIEHHSAGSEKTWT